MSAAQTNVGDPAPDFELDGSAGRIRLSEYRGGAANVAIFFMREFG